jgi:hypothetical protein
VFITVSSPKDIHWESKYNLTKNFKASVENLDFGDLNEGITEYIKTRIFSEIKHSLFLHLYESFHIKNARQGIERVIKPSEYRLIYRVDPPQMSRKAWKDMLLSVSGPDIDLEFPKSQRAQGIQFADILAGCVRSLLVHDHNFEKACSFFPNIRDCMIPKSKENPNPNLIFFSEINEELRGRAAAIWSVKQP